MNMIISMPTLRSEDEVAAQHFYRRKPRVCTEDLSEWDARATASSSKPPVRF